MDVYSHYVYDISVKPFHGYLFWKNYLFTCRDPLKGLLALHQYPYKFQINIGLGYIVQRIQTLCPWWYSCSIVCKGWQWLQTDLARHQMPALHLFLSLLAPWQSAFFSHHLITVWFEQNKTIKDKYHQ